MKSLLIMIGLTALFLFAHGVSLRAEDGIPDNCEVPSGAYYRAGVFARVEPHNRRLTLVDWSTGEVVQIVAADLPDTRILGWSIDCRYLAAAVGPIESMDTVVYDTTDNRRVGSVADARMQPHTITWGPENMLVVETRGGAILWNVPANTQVTLTESFDPFTARNFSRLRWDAAARTLVVNLAVGGRVAYDYTTGLETTVAPAAQVIGDSTVLNTVTTGNTTYPCAAYTYDLYSPFRAGPNARSYVYVEYDLPSPTVSLRNRRGEVLRVLEGDVSASWMIDREHSTNCRYAAASLGIPGQDASDTYVWNIETGQRVGIFPDARDIVHPITWGADSLVITTRDGAYLWYLPTDTRTLIAPTAIENITGQEGIRAFERVRFSDDGTLLFAVPSGAPDQLQVFDAYSGALLQTFPFQGYGRYGEFFLSRANRLVVVRPNSGPTQIFDRTSGVAQAITAPHSSLILISPDERFVVVVERRQLMVWDITALTTDPARTYTVPDFPAYGPYYRDIRFTDAVTVVQDGPVDVQYALNVETGALVTQAPLIAPAPLNGRTGYGSGSYCERNDQLRYEADANRIVLRDTAGEIVRVIRDGLPDLTNIRYSPTCLYIIAVQSAITTEPAPYDNRPVDDRDYCRHIRDLLLLDAATGATVLTVEDVYSYYGGRFQLNPDDTWAFINGLNTNYLWEAASGQLIPIESARIQDNGRPYWDMARGRIYIHGHSGALAIDLRTGQQTIAFGCLQESYCASFGYNRPWFDVRDNQTLFATQTGGAIGVFDLDTLEAHYFHIGQAQLHSAARMAVSPDKSLLAIGSGMIRIFRERTPENNAPYLREQPDFQFDGPDARVDSIRWIDNTTVETMSAEGVQRWNITTGEQVP